MTQHIASHDAPIPRRSTAQWVLLVVALTGVLGTAFVVADGLRFEPVKDEMHFLETSRQLTREFPPSIETLRSYEEMITPAAFLFWGLLDRWTGGDGAFAGRLCNLLMVGAIVCGIALRRGRPSEQGLLAALGVLAFPYLLGLGVHLYTDVPASFLALLGVRAHLRGRTVTGAALLCVAIATRQYMVAVPAALAAWEWSRSQRGEAVRWLQGGAAALAAASLLGWFAFFGGLAPGPGMERWLPRYPAPMLDANHFILEYGLYFLTAIACYFVLPEFLLFRRTIRWRSLATGRTAVIALVLGTLFLLFPPDFAAWNGGVVDRIGQFLLPPGTATTPRMIVYFGLALITVIRFGQRLDLAFWLLLVSFVILMKSQLPWDKYFMPTIVLLWFLKAEGALDDGVFPAPESRGNEADDASGLRAETEAQASAAHSPAP
jgi:hypothetical protein